MDTVYHEGYVLYTNVLYYKAAEVMGYDTSVIKRRIYEELWNGEYFYCSSTIPSFDQVGNALAVRWGLQKPDTIVAYRKKHFRKGLSNPPCLPMVDNIYWPCYMIGNQMYHNFGWTWVNLLFISIMEDDGELELFKKEIERRGVYEIYDGPEPVNQLFCVSQSDFSEAAGMYLLCSDRKYTYLV
tara:strand:- start:636 stop:1187 length:552 start_codon:yes stop_codon:yes gene_type:complete